MQDDQFQDRPDRPGRPRRDDRDYDDYEREDFRRDVPFPGKVLAAGIIWIIAGGLQLLGAAILLFAALVLSGSGLGSLFAGPAMCLGLFVGLIGAAFLLVGTQTVRGTAADTLGNSIGSIILGALGVAVGLANMSAGRGLDGFMNVLSGGGLITAGVLALIGRTDYKVWKRSQGRRRDSY
jgi:hypothetical protein